MSGGKKVQTRGWEEAGSEFYQENYPTDSDKYFHDSTTHLSTLLPSKQTRPATLQMQKLNRATFRRILRSCSQFKTETNTVRTATNATDIQISMLPDLSEGLSNEETIHEEIMMLKKLPIHMTQRKEMKYKILDKPNLRLRGIDGVKWRQRQFLLLCHRHWKEFRRKLELWNGDCRHLEGHFGQGILTYFQILRWLMYINIVTLVYIIIVVICPLFAFQSHIFVDCDFTNSTCCLSNQDGNNFTRPTISSNYSSPILFLFGGFYFDYYLKFQSVFVKFNYYLTYMLLTLVYLIAIMAPIVKGFLKSLKDWIIQNEGQFYRNCSVIFNGWDFCIRYDQTAKIRNKAIYNKISTSLKNQQDINKSNVRNTKLYFLRIVVNCILLAITLLSNCVIFYVFVITNNLLEKVSTPLFVLYEHFDNVLLSFLPSLVLISFNLLVNPVLKICCIFEQYSDGTSLKVTLFRSALFKLSLLVTFFVSVYNKKECTTKILNDICENNKCYEFSCLDTYIGDEIYKLVIIYVMVNILTVFLIDYPFSLIGSLFVNKHFFALQHFDVPNQLVDLIFFQSFCWLGCFYSPVLPIIFIFGYFVLFYVKKFHCLVNCKSLYLLYETADLKNIFMFIALIYFPISISPFIYTFITSLPTEICDCNFENNYISFTEISTFTMHVLSWLQLTFSSLYIKVIFVIFNVLLILIIYYYKVMSSANKHMVTVLKNQLLLEGYDKQFLLERLNLFIKRKEHSRTMALNEI